MIALVASVTGRASADFIVNDDFESDKYEDQDDFIAVWIPIAMNDPKSADLSTGFGNNSPQSVHIPNSVNDTRRNQLTFTSTPPTPLNIGDQLIWSFDFWESAPAALPRPFYATLQTSEMPDGSQMGQIVSMGLNNNQFQDDSGGNFFMASISGYAHAADDPDGGPDEHVNGTTSGAFFKLNDEGIGIRGDENNPPEWHNLKLVISTSDGVNADHEYYVDGALAETVMGVGPLQQYGVIRLGSGLSTGGAQMFFDNMKLEYVQGVAAVPEASAVAAMTLIGVLSAGAVWIRKLRTTRRNREM
jgi:hypothetical protein